MLGIEDYGSDNDSDQEWSGSSTTATSKPVTSQPPKTTGLSLPQPTSAKATGNRLGLPPPRTRQGQKKKITIDLPSLEDDEDDIDDKPAAKRSRLESGAGKSSLLSMLPVPKQKGSPLPPPKERVLGGGQGPGLVFKEFSRAPVESAGDDVYRVEDEDTTDVSIAALSASSVSFLPPSLQKGKTNISMEGPSRPKAAPKAVSAIPPLDFFSLGISIGLSLGSRLNSFYQGSSSKSSRSDAASPVPSTSSPPKLPTGVSSAPKVNDFIPPEPTPSDPYPGYYLTPTGQWSAYDPDYYKKFYDKWRIDYDKHVRALEKGQVKGFEGYDNDEAEEVSAQVEMERAKKDIQEREEKKKLTHGAEGAPAAPKMNIKGAALGGRARSRHQLSTLLTEAYTNREALEEKIAQGRRNRKEAGTKYGF